MPLLAIINWCQIKGAGKDAKVNLMLRTVSNLELINFIWKILSTGSNHRWIYINTVITPSVGRISLLQIAIERSVATTDLSIETGHPALWYGLGSGCCIDQASSVTKRLI